MALEVNIGPIFLTPAEAQAKAAHNGVIGLHLEGDVWYGIANDPTDPLYGRKVALGRLRIDAHGPKDRRPLRPLDLPRSTTPGLLGVSPELLPPVLPEWVPSWAEAYAAARRYWPWLLAAFALLLLTRRGRR